MEEDKIRFAVGVDKDSMKIVMLFNDPVNVLSLDEDEADKLALLLIRKATIIREVKLEETSGQKSQGQNRESGVQKEVGEQG
jgi:hypothetical protein